jgi:RNA polymerase sigma-70 factor (ECF subfamily)
MSGPLLTHDVSALARAGTAAADDDGKIALDAACDPAHAFAEHSSYVWNSLRRLGVASADLEDLTHDTFVAALRSWTKYDPARPLRPWLFAFAFGTASDYRRRAHRRFEVSATEEPLDEEALGAVEQLIERERRLLAQTALQAVSLSRRAVLILHELDDCTVPEIAAALEIPVATAYSRLRLAREEFAHAVRRLLLRAR